MTNWNNKGCVVCRRRWETGEQLVSLGINTNRNAYLHRCDQCGVYWEQYERYANVISREEAQKFYPKLFLEVSNMVAFKYVNELEACLLAAKNNEISVKMFIEKLVISDLALPSAKEVRDDGTGFEPVIFDKQGTNMLAAFSDKTRIGEITRVAEYCLVMNGLQLLRRIPPGYGVVINPGHEIGLELSPEGIAEIIKEMN